MRGSVLGVALACFVGVASALAQSSTEARDNWSECLDGAARYFATNVADPADVIASGIFGACEPQQTNYLKVLQAEAGNFKSVDDYLRAERQMRDGQRDRVIYKVLDARAFAAAKARLQKP